MHTTKFATPALSREQILAFLLFTWRRFNEDRCLQTAGALSYTSLFALVPLTTAVLGMLTAFPGFEEWREQLTSFVFSNFVPAAGAVVQGYLTEFAHNASRATVIGIFVLLFSAVSLMISIEDAFNRIWRVKAGRRATSRFVIYWTALSLGPLLVVAALAISSYLIALPFIDAAGAQFSLKARILAALPFLIMWGGLVAAYMVIPNRVVRLRDALIGALIAAVMFEAGKRGFAAYVTGMASYQQVYGALAMVPIFILWIYLSWIIVLLGASLTASMSAFEYRPPGQRITPDGEFSGLLRLLGDFIVAHRSGKSLSSSDLRVSEPLLTEDLLQRYLEELQRGGIVTLTDAGDWVLSRDPAGISVLELLNTGDYRLPYTRIEIADADAAALEPADALLHRVAAEVRSQLQIPLADILSADQTVPRATTPASIPFNPESP